ncbi:MAG: PRC-barrel domain-containing protein [Planctomycetaceae bacterium]|nr:PRC-barrel domain-containing protein [Planctomycetaceae bacterium]
MRGSLLIALLAVGLGLAVSVALQAADDQPGMANQQEQQGTEATGSKVLRANDLIGLEVMGENNEKLGKIDNLAVDEQTGQVKYVVISFGTTMGFGGKLLPIPWQAMRLVSMPKAGEQVTSETHCLVSINKDILQKAPGFQQGQWPNFTDQRWVKVINEFYRPYIAKRPSGTYTR